MKLWVGASLLRDAPRMDAIDSDGFCQSCLFKYQSLEITNGLGVLTADSTNELQPK